MKKKIFSTILLSVFMLSFFVFFGNNENISEAHEKHLYNTNFTYDEQEIEYGLWDYPNSSGVGSAHAENNTITYKFDTDIIQDNKGNDIYVGNFYDNFRKAANIWNQCYFNDRGSFKKIVNFIYDQNSNNIIKVIYDSNKSFSGQFCPEGPYIDHHYNHFMIKLEYKSLTDNSKIISTSMHELGHAIGLTDLDKYNYYPGYYDAQHKSVLMGYERFDYVTQPMVSDMQGAALILGLHGQNESDHNHLKITYNSTDKHRQTCFYCGMYKESYHGNNCPICKDPNNRLKDSCPHSKEIVAYGPYYYWEKCKDCYSSDRHNISYSYISSNNTYHNKKYYAGNQLLRTEQEFHRLEYIKPLPKFDNGNHTKKCKDCNYNVSEPHDYIYIPSQSRFICKNCGATSNGGGGIMSAQYTLNELLFYNGIYL